MVRKTLFFGLEGLESICFYSWFACVKRKKVVGVEKTSFFGLKGLESL